MLRKKTENVQDYAIGIDASMTATGVYMTSCKPELEDHHFISQTGAKDGSDRFRIRTMIDTIMTEITDHSLSFEFIAIEDYGPINKFAGKVTQRAEIIGTLKYFFQEEFKATLITVPPKSLKSYATGNGNANKAAMVQRAKDFGFFTESNDAADAFHLSRIARAIQNKARVNIAYQLIRP